MDGFINNRFSNIMKENNEKYKNKTETVINKNDNINN